jgi:hypothetical protein
MLLLSTIITNITHYRTFPHGKPQLYEVSVTHPDGSQGPFVRAIKPDPSFFQVTFKRA